MVDAGGATRTIIHFTYTVNSGDLDEAWRIACMPNMTEFHATPYHPNYLRTNDVRAANCPACRKTPEFMEAKRVLGIALRGPSRATS